uniref:Dihydrolipoamide acetyltransferase component of pyruvate dehydrogenase complex n=1 Tax=Fibrocapsa japonica TaxID=94617 RepID=A0A7S2XXU4_9STRA
MVGRFSTTGFQVERIAMPALSPTMESGTVAKWLVQEGGEFGPGDALCEVETDKATVAFEVQEDGVLAKILVEEGKEVKVGEMVALAVEDADQFAAFQKAGPEALANIDLSGGASASSAAVEDASPQAGSGAGSGSSASPSFLMPAARFMAESMGLDASGLAGTGRGGRVTKGDVVEALEAGIKLPPLAKPAHTTSPAAAAAGEVPAAPAPAAAAAAAPATVTTPASSSTVDLPPLQESSSPFEDIPANNIKKVTAKRLTESKATVPHYYVSTEVEIDAALKLRKDMAKEHEVKFSVNDLVIRSAALALRDNAEVNAKWNGSEVVPEETVDISIAVATPNGLITPIVTNADKKGLTDISGNVRDLATRARDNKLAPEEFMGGTFTISNLGMFGISEFSAVINLPQAAIMAVGTGARKVVPSPRVEGQEEIPPPRVATMMTATLSCDRRVINEAAAGKFMNSFKHYLSQPEVLLL